MRTKTGFEGPLPESLILSASVWQGKESGIRTSHEAVTVPPQKYANCILQMTRGVSKVAVEAGNGFPFFFFFFFWS